MAGLDAAPTAPLAKGANPPTVTGPIAVEPSFKVARVDQWDVLHVRSGPSADYAAIGALPPGERGVKIVGRCLGEWCPVRHHRVDGWINSFYLVEEVLGRERGGQPAPGRGRPQWDDELKYVR